jgi:CBS domain-containing protein
MDGGRILRALLATRLGHARATQIAATVGKVCAVIFGAIAVVTASLLLGIIALFVYAGAAGELAAERTHTVLDGLTVGQLLPGDRVVPTVLPSDSIETAARRMRELDRLAVLVVDSHGRPLRVVEADELAGLALRDGADEHLDAAAFRTPSKLVAVPVDADANTALTALAEAHADYLVPIDPVTSTVAGLLGPQELARAVKLRALGPHALH